jgi:hypothetical protein
MVQTARATITPRPRDHLDDLLDDLLDVLLFNGLMGFVVLVRTLVSSSRFLVVEELAGGGPSVHTDVRVRRVRTTPG